MSNILPCTAPLETRVSEIVEVAKRTPGTASRGGHKPGELNLPTELPMRQAHVGGTDK